MNADLLIEHGRFLDEVLPADYDERYQSYRADVGLRRDYQAAAFDEGWLVPGWEVGLGGRGLAGTAALAVQLAAARRRVPRLMNIQGPGVVAPSLRHFGSEGQRADLLAPTVRGDIWWALGMSEPGAGSDLASVRTRAVTDGDEFVITGQKVWTTLADESQWCTVYARTDPDAPRHQGITCFLVEMDRPGVDVRPIRVASPAIESFCEVFLDDVRVPASAMLGPLGAGWKVAVASLEHERDMIWINTWLEARRALSPAVAAHHRSFDESIGRALAEIDGLRLTGLRAAAERWADRTTPLGSILKLVGSEAVQRAAELSLEVLGVHALDDPTLFDERLDSLPATIYGGTSEIQRNIIAERGLGLPRE